MSRLVREMLKEGLVTTLPDPNDGRGLLVRISAKGRGLVTRSRNQKITMMRNLIETLGNNERTSVQAAVAALTPLAWMDEEE